jgi:glutamyl-tRNA synthetase
MLEWKKELSSLTDFSSVAIEALLKDFLTTKNVGMGAVMPLFRLVLVGNLTGPAASQVAELIGKEETLNRIDIAVQKFG